MRLAQGMLIGHWVGSVLRTDILMTVAQLICKIYSWESSKQTEIRTSNIELKKYGAQEKRELAFPIKSQYKLAGLKAQRSEIKKQAMRTRMASLSRRRPKTDKHTNL